MTKKKICSFAIVLAMMFALFTTTGFGIEINAADGDIESADDLLAIGDDPSNLTKHYILTDDIDFDGEDWEPIDNFSGTLDGAGHVIRGLSAADGGLFKNLAAGAVIKNLGFEDADVTNSGVIAQTAATGAVKSCYAINSTTDSGNLLVGTSTPAGCYFGPANTVGTNVLKLVKINPTDMEFTVKYDFVMPAGAGTEASPYIVGIFDDLKHISELVNYGVKLDYTADFSSAEYELNNSINLSGLIPIGTEEYPFTGDFNGNYKTIGGSIAKNSDGDSGLFGYIEGASIEKLGITASAAGIRNVGGLVGTADGGDISQCYSAGTVSSSSPLANESYVGGLIGKTIGSVDISYSYYSTSGAGSNLSGGTNKGGLIGRCGAASITNCYTTATNIVGKGASPTLSNSFCAGASDGTSTKTLTQMKNPQFVITLNSGGNEIYGSLGSGKTPVIRGFGLGTDTGLPHQITFAQPQNGTLKVYNSSKTEIKTGEYLLPGTVLSVDAEPASSGGYELLSVTANGNELTSDRITMGDEDLLLEAEFTSYPSYTITVVKNDGGTVTPSDSKINVKKNTTQSFEIIPNDDCRIQSVTYTGNGMTIDDDTYTTGKVSRNETLTVKFVSKSDGVKDVEVTEDGTVITVKTLADVADQINDDNEGNTIKVEVKSPVIDKKTLKALEDYNINVVLDMDDYSWRINGRSIVDSDSSINLGVDVDASSIDQEFMSQFEKFEDITQLDLTYSGEFPFTGYLTIEAPGDTDLVIGKYANLFYFNEDTEEFEAMDSVKIDDDGNATFKFSHASKYVVAVADEPLTEQDLSVGAVAFDNVTPISKKTTDIIFASILLLLVAAGGITLTVVFRKSK